MNKVIIEPIRELSQKSESATHEVLGCIPNGFLVLNRKKGSISGNHWHEGAVKSKNPLAFILVIRKSKY